MRYPRAIEGRTDAPLPGFRPRPYRRPPRTYVSLVGGGRKRQIPPAL